MGVYFSKEKSREFLKVVFELKVEMLIYYFYLTLIHKSCIFFYETISLQLKNVKLAIAQTVTFFAIATAFTTSKNTNCYFELKKIV